MKILYRLGSLNQEEKELEATKKKYKMFVNGLEAELGPLKKLESTTLRGLVYVLAYNLIREKVRCEETSERERIMFQAIVRSENVNQKRIYYRPDQVDKRAFQKAVITNDYPTIADAIRDLRIKPQFETYNEATLRRWAKEIREIELKERKKQNREK